MSGIQSSYKVRERDGQVVVVCRLCGAERDDLTDMDAAQEWAEQAHGQCSGPDAAPVPLTEEDWARIRTAHRPAPNDRLLGRTVVATCAYIEDDQREPEMLVLLLNAQPPYFTVAHAQWALDPPVIVASENHSNIVPAVNGDTFPDKPGYVDMGGDY